MRDLADAQESLPVGRLASLPTLSPEVGSIAVVAHNPAGWVPRGGLAVIHQRGVTIRRPGCRSSALKWAEVGPHRSVGDITPVPTSSSILSHTAQMADTTGTAITEACTAAA